MKKTKELSTLVNNLEGVDNMIEELNRTMAEIVEQDSSEFGSIMISWHPTKPAMTVLAEPLISVEDQGKPEGEVPIMGFQAMFSEPVDSEVNLTSFYLPVGEFVPIMTKMRAVLKQKKKKLKFQISELT